MLDLSRCHLFQGLQGLCEGSFPALSSLDMSSTTSRFVPLGDLACLTALRTLKLRWCVDSDGLMTPGDRLLQLTKLDLCCNDLDETSIQALVQAKCCNLVHLDLQPREWREGGTPYATMLGHGQAPLDMAWVGRKLWLAWDGKCQLACIAVLGATWTNCSK